ncbi:LysR family transcriptional regulator [Loktanella sp. IMCC34160]|uniref:LysR family transcriptional regulator n=1 Tax=Loktanella sp. IMCC34160 TaxID=2510646 RepID=UPI00101BBC84|nr:LysR family transcriptional regulator [Loktanella sp. IMCC34160]RYG92755.1 LysR family transcriptional regulator [Loktanella sp. IMCC34160]
MTLAPPPMRLPALNALRAFEAAARLGGFAAAAEELGVTPGAVTAHIKGLEADLGAPLFERQAKGVQLTALGARCLPALSEAFDSLGIAVQTLRAEAAPQVVQIAALPAVAQLWLSPRLPGLRAAFPGLSVSITAMERPPNLKRAPYDMTLFYEAAGGVVVARDEIFPVCAPTLARHVKAASDLSLVPCLSDAVWSEDWQVWAAEHAPGLVPRGPVHSLFALAVEEAVNGAGVLMAHGALVERHLDSGALVAPLPGRVRLDRDLRLGFARPPRPGSAVARVADWLRSSGEGGL